jgi:hypothetical protein
VELPVLIACLLSPIVLVSRVGVFAAVVPLVFVATLGVLWRGGAITPAQEQGR